MSGRVLVISLALLVVGLPGASAAQSPADTIRSLDSAWARSYATHDTMLAKAIFADDLVITGPNGNLKDKRAELGDVAAQPELQLEYFRTSDVTVRMLDGAAVVIGLAEWRFVFRGGPPTTTRMRYTAVYARRGARWQMVALHLGRVRD